MGVNIFLELFRWVTVLVFLCYGSPTASALEGFVGKEGVCSKNVTVEHKEPYRVWKTNEETYTARCGFLSLKTCTKVRTAGHWETVPYIRTEIKVEESCCSGYEDVSGRCMPVCTSACENSLCTAPDHCTCLGGFVKHEDSDVCEPVCTESCAANQYCSAPGQCSCNSNYTDINGTCEPLCEPACVNSVCSSPNTCVCNEGFDKDPENSNRCNAICNVTCHNGYCSEPGICSCNDGYQISDSDPNSCEPICSKKCVYGNCSSDNVCVCLEKYKHSEEDSFKCDPICEKECPAHAFCSSPDECSCDEGYQRNEENSDICNPICSKYCQNGICISPEVCTCLTHYTPSADDPYICSPICNEECVNGFCSSPENCTCNEGYKKVNEDGNICEPICNQECENGFCSGPDICSCFAGYKEDLMNPFICTPICSTPCMNASCSNPEECTCYPGYEHSPMESHRCQPICHDTCINAVCSDPDVCSCLEGFIRDNDHAHVCNPFCSRICQNGSCSAPEVCSCFDGFKLDPEDSQKCNPICVEDCVNGICSMPNVCECLEGYQPDEDNNKICHPVCSEECKHGVCNGPNKCLCDAGFVEAENDPYTCVPHCHKACINGNCTAPNFCECYPNHEKDKDNYHICNAICTEGCTNGICVIPDTCMCLDGYHFEDNPNYCEPVCSACAMGTCDAPEMCKCSEGYRNPPENNSTCEPMCVQDCINGYCSAPNVCECSEGFKKNSDEWDLCSPYCTYGCLNGECTAPDVCECHPGYKVDIESQVCSAICSEECTNGTCVAPEKCSCLWGFHNSEMMPNSCSLSLTSAHECLFQMNLLTENVTEECYNTNQKLKLAELNDCVFMRSLVMKYFLNQTGDNAIPYGIKLDCSLDYLNGNEDDQTLQMLCSVDKIFDATMENEIDDALENDTELESDSDFRYKGSSVVDQQIAQKPSQIKEKFSFETAVIGDDESLKEGTLTELPLPEEPIVYMPPLIPGPPPKTENSQSFTMKPVSLSTNKKTELNAEKSSNSEVEKGSSDGEGQEYVFPALKRTLQNLAFDLWKKKKEPEPDNLSDEFFKQRFAENPLTTGTDNDNSKNTEKPDETTDSDQLMESSDEKVLLALTPKTKHSTSHVPKKQPSELENSESLMNTHHSNDKSQNNNDSENREVSRENQYLQTDQNHPIDQSSLEDSTEHSKLPHQEQLSIAVNQEPNTDVNRNVEGSVHRIRNRLAQAQLTIKINSLPFIKTQKITVDHFNKLPQTTLKDDLCLCFKQETTPVCVGDENVKLVVCRCTDGIDEEATLGFMQKPYVLATMVAIIVLVILGLCLVLYAVKRCQRRRKFTAVAAKDMKRKQDISTNNSLHVQINGSGPPDDLDTTKL